jgi:SNF2 family DNA or RNA helicase
MLDLIQKALESHGFSFCRIDGSTSLEERRNAMLRFNKDPKCTIMLASIGSAGEGWVESPFTYIYPSELMIFASFRVDLTVANHVHLVEPHWNPMAELQAIDRVHRIGQVREVVIRRYLVRSSIEMVR